MSQYLERAFFFDCAGESLPGIIACPSAAPRQIGVLIVVGGPQYRVGSQRQFVLLARELAAAGVACMRFDVRGMGDASGAARAFDTLNDDIRTAVDAFYAQMPGLAGVMLWGLCDGASASVFYAAAGDARVAGLVLLNPWVRTEVGAARTRLRHYYVQRLLSAAFWRKLCAGGVHPLEALDGLWRTLRRAWRSSGRVASEASPNTAARMRIGLQALAVPWWVILSGCDDVAREFERLAASPEWAALRAARTPYRLDEADHTFSRATWRAEVARQTLAWVRAAEDQRGQA
ncbi:hydrolase 1, exosortase A system-associated [Betaproteobacteria bacterium]|nr:hydrolase 1, exosortase A system-associated [Betaproteobacteria bacterium]GHU22891.1 hydrolase 1, exosortase A system-associated [Betaproteobacteria bacterium]